MIRLSGVGGETRIRRRNETTPTRCRRESIDIEIEDDLHVARSLERGDGLARGHVLREGKDLRVHDAAGRLLFVFEQLADIPTSGTLLHLLEHGAGELLGQIVDECRGVVRGEILDELDDLVSRAIGQQAGARFGTELARAFHRESAVALDEQRERRLAILVAELGEELREVGGMLLLQQVDQVGGRPHALEALHRIEHDIELALGHWQSNRARWNCSM